MKLEGTTSILSGLSVVQQKQQKASPTALKEAGLHLSPKALMWP